MERVDRGERTFVVVAERGLGSTTVWSRLRYQLHHQSPGIDATCQTGSNERM